MKKIARKVLHTYIIRTNLIQGYARKTCQESKLDDWKHIDLFSILKRYCKFDKINKHETRRKDEEATKKIN